MNEDKEYKFDKAFLENENREIDLEDLLILFFSDKPTFEKRFKPFLRCPKCKFPQLNFINATAPYLRLWPNKRHLDSCSIKNPPMDHTVLDTLSLESKRRSSIKHSLEYLLKEEDIENLSQDSHDVITTTEASVSSLKSSKETPKKSYYVPARKLNKRLNENDLGVVKRFYGIVELKWLAKSLTWATGRSLSIYLLGKDKPICSVKMPVWMFNQLSKIVSVCNVAKKYKIAFAAEVILKDGKDGGVYYEFHLKHPDFFQVKSWDQ